MKTGVSSARANAATIVALTDVEPADRLVDAAAPDDKAHNADNATQVQRARAFAGPLLAGQPLDTGEDALEHADGVADILEGIGAAPSMRAAAYLVYAGDHLQKP